MSNYNVILLTDNTNMFSMQKTLGAYKVATELRLAGIDVAIIDHLHIFEAEEIKYLLSVLVNEKTLFVGINNFFYKSLGDWQQMSPGSFLPHGPSENTEIKKIVTSRNPRCKLVLGGPTAQDAEYNKDFDYVVAGYADVAVINLAKHLMNPATPLNKSRKSIFGFTVINDAVAEGFDFVNSRTIFAPTDTVLPGEVLPIEMSRGCIFKCTFCSYPLNGKKKFDYIRNAECIYTELIDNYTKFGITRYNVIDDTFNDSVEKCQLIYDISKRLPFKLEYHATCRLDLLAAHPETIPMLLESGARLFFFGIETLDSNAARAIRKTSDRQRLIKTLHLMKETATDTITLHGNFIFGLPYESEESIQRTIDWLSHEDCPLDSWYAEPLGIFAEPERWTSGFVSDIDANPAKFGYRQIGVAPNGINMIWQNEHTTFTKMQEAARLADSRYNKSVHGMFALEWAGLGLNLDEYINKRASEVDYNGLVKAKLRRSQEYKKILYTNLGIQPYKHSYRIASWLLDHIKNKNT